MNDTRSAEATFSYRRHFPWLHLFRGFRIAVDPRKLLLAALGLMLVSAGNWAIGRLSLPDGWEGVTAEHAWPWQEPAGYGDPLSHPRQALSDPAGTLWSVATNWRLVLRPAADVVEPALLLVRPDLTWPRALYAWTRLLWALLIWALLGGAITRMAAVEFARDQQIGIRTALNFSAEKLLSYFTAPLLAVAGIGFFWLLCLAGGFLIGWIPYVGPAIVGALWIVPLVLGVLMTLILIGVSAGWPLMFVTVSAEGSDAFDGLSRSFGYVYERPWHYLWYAVVAIVYGSVVIFFVMLLVAVVVYLAGWSVASGMGMDRVAGLYSAAPEQLGGRDLLSRATPEASTGGAMLTTIWLYAAAVVQIGFVYSYFWTAATIIYFLLRQSDDAIDLDEVHLPQQTQEDDLLPLVGVADSDQPVVERPPAEVSSDNPPDDDPPSNDSAGEKPPDDESSA